MNNTNIDYEAYVEEIRDEMESLLSEINSATEGFFAKIKEHINGLRIYVNDEQDYIKLKEIDRNGLYVNVCFLDASVNFASSVVPINLKILGTANKIKPAQLFMAAFAGKYSTKDFVENTNTQIWLTPRVGSNFDETGIEFRTLFSVSGTLVIGQDIVRLNKLEYEYETGRTEEIFFLSWQEGFENSLNPQPFGNTGGYAVSESNFSTFAFSINTYMLDSRLVADCFNIKGFRKRVPDQNSATGYKRISSNLNGNSTLKLYLDFTNGFTNRPETGELANSNDPFMGNDILCKFHVRSITKGQNIGDIPTISIGFSL